MSETRKTQLEKVLESSYREHKELELKRKEAERQTILARTKEEAKTAEEQAKVFKEKSEEEKESVKKFVVENLDKIRVLASQEYQAWAIKEAKKALESKDFEKAEKIIREIRQHLNPEVLKFEGLPKKAVLKDRKGRVVGYINYEYKLDDKDRIEEKFYKNENGEIIWSNKYEYDQKNRVIKGTRIDAENNVILSFEYEYNNNDKIKKEILKDKEGRTFSSCWYKYKYNHKDKIEERITENEKGEIIGFCTYEYNEENKTKKIIYKDKRKEIIYSEEYSY